MEDQLELDNIIDDGLTTEERYEVLKKMLVG